MIKTLSGRFIPAPLKIRLDSPRKTIIDLKKLHQWLIDQTLDEARSRNDEYGELLFINEKAGKLSQGTIALMNSYLFGN